jgi:hypothetical protein
MTMKYVLLVMVLTTMMSPPAYAKDKGHGPQVNQHSTPSTATTQERVKDEIVDAVADELLGEDSSQRTTTGSRPPGMSKQDSVPPGLEKKGKVPPGWSKGEKKGWDASTTTTMMTEKEDSLLRRMVRSVFRGKQEDETQ